MVVLLALAEKIHKLTGADVFVREDYSIEVYGKKRGYTIVCDDADDCYNSLTNLLDGAELYAEMHGEEK